MHKFHMVWKNTTTGLLRSIPQRSYMNGKVKQNELFEYEEEVLSALNNGKPTVALESTIITHGMPYPHNLETAFELENIVREKGAVPATISIIKGKIQVGTSKQNLERLANGDKRSTLKCSRRDFSYILSRKLNGGTTVSGTMLVAHKAGVPILATGGIGGVHRGAQSTFDISADLSEFARTPVTVVCAGIKAILDIPKTLEYLETLGVPVISLSDSDSFPSFWSAETFDKVKSPMRLSCIKEAADLISMQRELDENTGTVLAVPIPAQFAFDPNEIESVIQRALLEAERAKIVGKNVTPFLLEKVMNFTEGRSLIANKALINNNASIAADIAVRMTQNSSSNFQVDHKAQNESNKRPIVIGGAVSDTTLQIKEPHITLNGSTHHGQSRKSCGGVGRNVASALVKLGLGETRLVSVVGDDEDGEIVIRSFGGPRDTFKVLSKTPTARYTAILNSDGECCLGIGEMQAFGQITQYLIKEHQTRLKEAPLIVLDGNPPLETMRSILEIAASSQIPVWYEPTDLRKAVKIFESGAQWRGTLRFVSPNRNELMAMARYFKLPFNDEKLDVLEVRNLCEQLADFGLCVVCTVGSEGVIIARRSSGERPFLDEKGRLVETGSTQSRLYPPLKSTTANTIVSVSGCGDCLAAGIISGILDGLKESDCVLRGLKAAEVSIKSLDPVPEELSLLMHN